MSEGTPTRSALLELQDERHVMAEGFRFLDEKRLLLAARIMELLERYRILKETHQDLNRQAAQAMREAVMRHGFQGVLMQPAKVRTQAQVTTHESRFFGVSLVEVAYDPGEDPPLPPAVDPSHEVTRCREIFARLLAISAEYAGVTANLHRLIQEYRRTERRARALEDVILPELVANVAEMSSRLEEVEQEEAVRVRLAGQRMKA